MANLIPKIDAQAQVVADMAAQKYTSGQIAAAIGMSKSTVSAFCRRRGIPLNTNVNVSPRSPARHDASKHGIRWNGPKLKPLPAQDKSMIGQAITYMRQHYPWVYRSATVTGNSNDDRIICGARILEPTAFLTLASDKGFR